MIIEINNPIFGKNIRFLRKKYRLSQTALACLIGVSPEHIRWVEQGKYSAIFTDYNMLRLCEVLNIPMEHLTGTNLEEVGTIPYIRNKKE